MINLTNKAKTIIGIVVGVVVIAGVIGGSIAIANAVKKNKQSKCEHVYDAGQITAEATCENPGMIVYTCGECGYELTEEIPANGHVNSVIEAIPATCTAKGLTDGIKCVTCEKVLVSPVETPMLGHNVTALKAVAATCTNDGKTEGSMCSRCGEIIKAQTVIPAKGHTVVEVKGYAATCTATGKTNGSKCSGCGIVYSEQEDIPMVAHVYAEGKCVACGKAEQKTENFTEMDVTVGEKVVGQWYRMYRSAEGLYDGFTISCTVNGIASQEQVSETTTLSFGVLPKSATEGQNAFVIFPGHGSPEFIEGVEIYVTEDYIEIFLPEGLEIPFKWVSGSTTIFDCVYTITADSSITEILFSSTVKRMVMSE